MKYFLLSIFFIISGCTDQTTPEVKERNKNTLKGEGFIIGEINGKKVRQYEIDRGDTGNSHYLYLVDGNDTVNTNFDVKQGKTTYNQTNTTIFKNGMVKVNVGSSEFTLGAGSSIKVVIEGTEYSILVAEQVLIDVKEGSNFSHYVVSETPTIDFTGKKLTSYK